MTNITYTTSRTPDSSAVDAVYYNENTNTLFVDLNDRVYEYSNVPRTFFDEVDRVLSVGSIWLPQLKRKYGPGNYLGLEYELKWSYAPVSETRQDVPVTHFSLAPSSDVTVNVSNGVSGNSTGAHLSLSAPARSHDLYGVAFEVDGKTNVHSLYALDEAEAVQSVLDIADMLDLTFKIVSVTHHFE